MISIWIICGVAIVTLAVIVAVVLLRKREKPPLTVNQILSTAKRSLQEHKPTLTVAAKGKDRVPYVPETDNPKKLAKRGVYHLITSDVFVTYTVDKLTDEAEIALREPGEKLTLTFADAELNGMYVGKKALSMESFDVRQGAASAGNLRRLIRNHLWLPGGEMEE